MRSLRTVTLVVIAVGMLVARAAYAEVPTQKKAASNTTKFEVGKHYFITVEEADGDEFVTTRYWATVQQADEKSVTLADGEWTQETNRREKRSHKALVTFASRIERLFFLFGGKPTVGIVRGIPMEDDTVILSRRDITVVRPMTDDEVHLRKESHISSRPRPPHIARDDNFD